MAAARSTLQIVNDLMTQIEIRLINPNINVPAILELIKKILETSEQSNLVKTLKNIMQHCEDYLPSSDKDENFKKIQLLRDLVNQILVQNQPSPTNLTEEQVFAHSTYVDLKKFNPETKESDDTYQGAAKLITITIHSRLPNNEKIAELTEVAKQFPYLGTQAMCEIGRLYAEEKEYRKALKIGQQALAIEERPHLISSIRYLLATQHEALNEFKEAKEQLIQLMQLNQKQDSFLTEMNQILLSNLIKYEKKLIETKLQSLYFQKDLTKAYKKISEKAEKNLKEKYYSGALENFNKLIYLNPHNAALYQDRSKTRIGLNDFKSALDDITIAIWLVGSKLSSSLDDSLPAYIQHKETILKLMSEAKETKETKQTPTAEAPTPTPQPAPKKKLSASQPKKQSKPNKELRKTLNTNKAEARVAANEFLAAKRLEEEIELKQQTEETARQAIADKEIAEELRRQKKKEKEKEKSKRKKLNRSANKTVASAASALITDEENQDTGSDDHFSPETSPTPETKHELQPLEITIALPPKAIEYLEKLKSSNPNSCSYVVGGLPRDLLSKELKLLPDTESKQMETDEVDIDIVTSLSKEEILTIPGITQHPMEPNLFNVEKNKNIVIYCSDHLNTDPSLWKDANQRDFTINAFYADEKGQVFDPTGRGFIDLNSKHFVSVRATVKSFDEDPIRILRAIYFKTKLGFEFKNSEKIKASIKQYTPLLLSKVDPGRVNFWLSKLLCRGKAAANFALLLEFGILQQLFSPDLVNYQVQLLKALETADNQYAANSKLKTGINMIYAFFIKCCGGLEENKLIQANFSTYKNNKTALLNKAGELLGSPVTAGLTAHSLFPSVNNSSAINTAPPTASNSLNHTL